jgi:methylenetetrahydrofolate dehydrogenase (NADP+)/methenyltetrahydrofolate cyclohydrolase
MELLQRSGVALSGKHVVVLGRSLIVGKPAALLAMQRKSWANATVTVCHSQTANLPAITRQAHVLIAAIGKAEFVTADMVKPGAVVIDVGVNRVADPSKKSGYRLTGDVHFPTVAPLCSKITPVPGGVGPMTVAMLMKNTVKARRQNGTAPGSK